MPTEYQWPLQTPATSSSSSSSGATGIDAQVSQQQPVPRDFLLDANGDIAVVNGDLVLVYDEAAIAQECQVALRFFRGEWYADLDNGTDWLGKVLGQKDPSNSIARAMIIDRLLSRPGVLAVNDLVLTLDAQSRTLNVTFSLDTSLGPLHNLSTSIQV